MKQLFYIIFYIEKAYFKYFIKYIGFQSEKVFYSSIIIRVFLIFYFDIFVTSNTCQPLNIV